MSVKNRIDEINKELIEMNDIMKAVEDGLGTKITPISAGNIGVTDGSRLERYGGIQYQLDKTMDHVRELLQRIKRTDDAIYGEVGMQLNNTEGGNWEATQNG